MKVNQQFTAIIHLEGRHFVALRPELDIASQGKPVEEARYKIAEAVELFFEAASSIEVKRRLRKPTYVTQVEVTVG